MRRIRILVADDTEIGREGMRGILLPVPDMEVIAAVGVPVEVARKVAELGPDVVLIDLKWGPDETAGCSVIREIRAQSPDVAVIAVTGYPQLIRDSRQAGADLGLSKEFTRDELLRNIRGLAFRPHASAGGASLKTPTIVLTDRERQVLELLVEGLRNREISERLNISPTTVKNHVANILEKLGVENRLQASNVARQLRLVR